MSFHTPHSTLHNPAAALAAAASAEALKLRRTLALRLAVLMPLLVVLLQSAVVFRVPRSRLNQGLWRMLEGGCMGWAIFMLPLLAALLTALLNGIEHRENNWKQLFATPVPRWSIYVAKVLAAHALIAIASLSLAAGLLASGYVLHAVLPAVPFGPAPWASLFGKLARIFAASAALISIHLWISARAKTFPLPLGLGVAAVLVSIIALNDRLTTFWPWMFPGNTQIADRAAWALPLSLPLALLFTFGGALDTSRRDVL